MGVFYYYCDYLFGEITMIDSRCEGKACSWCEEQSISTYRFRHSERDIDQIVYFCKEHEQERKSKKYNDVDMFDRRKVE